MSIRLVVWSAAATALYIFVVALLGFQGFIANALNFWRVVLSVAVLIVYIPTISEIFREVPPPRRDYLLAGIILTWLSAICFSVSNEAGRIFGYPTSVYVNPLAGAFSLLLVLGGLFHLLAPGTATIKNSIIAVTVGILVGATVLFIAPMFAGVSHGG